MITPILNKGDKISIVSPAGRINSDYVKSASNILTKLGYEVSISPNCLSEHNNFSSTDKNRLADLQNAINDTDSKAILCSRGGYGLIKILNQLDISPLLKHPKWIIGFSDITILHLALNKCGLKSIHGPMAKTFHDEADPESINNLINTLHGKPTTYTVDSNNANRIGESEAELIGGNLSIIYSLQGTPYEIETKDKILFIEDLSEYLYHLDRIMINLKLSGKLSNLKGLIIGGFTDMKDNDKPFGKSSYEIISEHVAEYSYPVCFDFPAGHIKNNQPIVLGQKYRFSVNKNACVLRAKI